MNLPNNQNYTYWKYFTELPESKMLSKLDNVELTKEYVKIYFYDSEAYHQALRFLNNHVYVTNEYQIAWYESSFEYEILFFNNQVDLVGWDTRDLILLLASLAPDSDFEITEVKDTSIQLTHKTKPNTYQVIENDWLVNDFNDFEMLENN